MTAPEEPLHFTDPEACAEAILSRVGKRVVLGLPLGIGKANHIANALYARAEADRSIDLDIYTALSLSVPRGRTDLERRLLRPLFARLLPDYPGLSYDAAQRDGRLPANVTVREFFLPAGRRLDAPLSQQGFVCANYTHVARDLIANGVNAVAQLVATRGAGAGRRLSLGSNPDVALDLTPLLRARRAAGARVVIAGQTSRRMPFMLGQAEVAPRDFDLLLDTPACDFELFPLPKQPVTLARHAAALRVATLIEDGGTLQIGIGSFADAVTQALKLRQAANDDFRRLVAAIAGPRDAPTPALAPFDEGLYAASEMLVEGLLELKDAGVVKRRVAMSADAPGPVVHAAFFLGTASFYERLRTMPDDELADIAMTAVSFVNHLHGEEELKRAQRLKARFVNTALMATLLGAVVSDGLADGRVISGVGGQYNFVAQAHELEGARSIVALDAVHVTGGRPISNIRWTYGHVTIPRHLRDIVVTEYGIADLRGRSDAEVVAAMIEIADSRFQDELLAEARRARKIDRRYEIPAAARANLPEAIERALAPARAEGLLPHFPLGSDMTPIEERLTVSLLALKEASGSGARLARLALRSALGPAPTEEERACLERLELHRPASVRDRLAAWAVLWALRRTSPD